MYSGENGKFRSPEARACQRALARRVLLDRAILSSLRADAASELRPGMSQEERIKTIIRRDMAQAELASRLGVATPVVRELLASGMLTEIEFEEIQQGGQTCAGGPAPRRRSSLYAVARYLLLTILPLILALLALLVTLSFCAGSAEGAEHPFGESGSARRRQIEAETNALIRYAYTYAVVWAAQNNLPIPDRVPGVVYCRDEQDLAFRTGFPASENGGRVVARADIEANLIYLSRVSAHDVYHECYHTMFRSWSDLNAEAFSAWCLKMDEQLVELKFGKKLPERRGK